MISGVSVDEGHGVTASCGASDALVIGIGPGMNPTASHSPPEIHKRAIKIILQQIYKPIASHMIFRNGLGV